MPLKIGGEIMQELILILAFAGTFYLVVKQFAVNIALVFDDKNEKKGR